MARRGGGFNGMVAVLGLFFGLPLIAATIWAGVTWVQRLKFQGRAVHIKADVTQQEYQGDDGKVLKDDGTVKIKRRARTYYHITYEFVAAETKQKYGRKVTLQAMENEQTNEDVSNKKFDVVYDPRDPKVNFPTIHVQPWVNGRMSVFFVLGFATLLVCGFFLVATFTNKQVLYERLETGHARM